MTVLSTLLAAVPLCWTVETSRLQPAVFEAYHGETLELAAAFQTYGKPFAISGDAALYYQTNGMGAAWWQAPATVASNTISAVFTPALDPGASSLRCFLGGTSSTYRAAFTLRFAASPGATPNLLPLPRVNYDLELLGTPTINGTNLVEFISRTTETDPHAAGIVSGIVTKAYVEGLGITGGTGGGGAVASVNGQTGTVVLAASDVGAVSLANGGIVSNNIELYNGTDLAVSPRIQFSALWNGDKLTRSIYANDIGMYLDGVYSMSMYNSTDWSGITRNGGTSLQNDLDEKANGYTVNDLSATLSSATSTLSTVSSTVSQWSTYWDGDDVRVTITNYYGSSSLPSMYLEQKVADGGTNYFRTVWNELTRWNQFIGPEWNWMSSSWIGFNAWRTDITAQLDQKADRAWGYCDSHAGGYAPDGYTWISSPRIAISGGMAYQRFGDSAHAVWVLESNGLVTETSGVATNGYFKISDDEGNEMFAIRKGDKRTVGATCGSITTTVGAGGITHVHCTYAVVSGDHPTISTTADLANPNWKDETSADSIANVTWTGSSGDWHAEVWGKTDLSSMFIRATYEVGGETMIENAAPVKMNYIYLGGTNYSLGTASISGHTVLTLTPAQ